MSTAPVMVFTYSRPEHTKKVLEALNENHLAPETDVYTYTCTAKNDRSQPDVERTKDVLRSFEDNNRFRSYNVVDIGIFLPLGPAMIRAVTETVNKNGKVIIVEDDIVTSKDFLTFMNECLDRYENSKNIFSVSGYSPHFDYLDHIEGDVYAVHRACPWGWGTWSDRWDQFDPRVEEYIKTMKDRDTRRRITRWNTDLPMTLDALFYEKGCMEKNWEQQFCYAQFLKGMNVICPKVSKVENIGFDGTGTHDIPTGLISKFDPEGSGWTLSDPTVDDILQKKYNRMFVFRRKTRMMIMISNMVHFVSPSIYYKLLTKYYKNDPDLPTNE